MSIKLLPGLYESLVNQFIDVGIAEAARENLCAELRGLDAGDSHDYFAQYLASHIRKAFASLPLSERLEKQVELANRILALLADSAPTSFDQQQCKVMRAELLIALSLEPIQRADTPLSTSCLMGPDRILVWSLNCERKSQLPMRWTSFARSSSGVVFAFWKTP